jgi:imidazolonepropionase-like amidohydrolase
MDSFNPLSPSIKKALSGGITAANVMPGSGLLMSGQTIYVKLRAATDVQDMLLCSEEYPEVCGGLKMANGTNPIGSGNSPGTRAKSAALVRALFVEAQDYQQKIMAAQDEENNMPARNLRLETLIEVLEGRRTVHHHTHRHDDVLTAIRLADEFGYDMVLQHVSEAYKVADEIAASGHPSSIITLDSFGGKMEAKDFSNANGAALEQAGAAVGIHTDDYVTDSRLFLRSAAFAVREGMSRDKALEALTLANAKMMRIDNRVGSLKKGKDADLVILSGDPFSVYTHVEQTWIEGQKIWDRSNPEDKKIATGGYGVFRLNTHTHTHEGGQ